MVKKKGQVFHHGDCFGSSPSEEQQFTVPRCAAEAPDELHATAVLEVLPGVFRHVPADLQGLEVVKVCTAQLP